MRKRRLRTRKDINAAGQKYDQTSNSKNRKQRKIYSEEIQKVGELDERYKKDRCLL